MSGAKAARPSLLALEVAQNGDQLVVWRLDRLGRSMSEPIYHRGSVANGLS
jgi:DNA invertase Pin-like site-specific DNA recombinase